ncbi:hypothetical protein CPB84DRAFT_1849382 [Gymnopilus junonius]|uniref:CHAT domain-containing protein n=1 Tax=Gymnopilus junonius TaxID=109634 RepID=A0A9P5TJR5_GYMJU|nr:hypothetical protein CPB84DRAFT_1849382 [Gymnopilus junonius]
MPLGYTYDGPSTPTESITDYAVSSYLATIGTLLNNQARNQHDKKADKVLVAVHPKSFLAALDELHKIEKRIEAEPSISLVKFGDHPSNPATVKQVLRHLPSVSVLSLSMIMEEDMKNAQLAVLSACETATGEQGAPDESLHLGAALVVRGIQRRRRDDVQKLTVQKIADEFYGKLVQNEEGSAEGHPTLDTTQAARALHHAVLELRAAGAPLQRLVPFIYLGI